MATETQGHFHAHHLRLAAVVLFFATLFFVSWKWEAPERLSVDRLAPFRLRMVNGRVQLSLACNAPPCFPWIRVASKREAALLLDSIAAGHSLCVSAIIMAFIYLVPLVLKQVYRVAIHLCLQAYTTDSLYSSARVLFQAILSTIPDRSFLEKTLARFCWPGLSDSVVLETGQSSKSSPESAPHSVPKRGATVKPQIPKNSKKIDLRSKHPPSDGSSPSLSGQSSAPRHSECVREKNDGFSEEAFDTEGAGDKLIDTIPIPCEVLPTDSTTVDTEPPAKHTSGIKEPFKKEGDDLPDADVYPPAQDSNAMVEEQRLFIDPQTTFATFLEFGKSFLSPDFLREMQRAEDDNSMVGYQTRLPTPPSSLQSSPKAFDKQQPALMASPPGFEPADRPVSMGQDDVEEPGDGYLHPDVASDYRRSSLSFSPSLPQGSQPRQSSDQNPLQALRRPSVVASRDRLAQPSPIDRRNWRDGDQAPSLALPRTQTAFHNLNAHRKTPHHLFPHPSSSSFGGLKAERRHL